MDYIRFYLEWLDLFAELTEAEIGKITLAAFRYSVNGKEPELEDRGLRIVWKAMKGTIDRTNAASEARAEIARANGRKGGAPKGNANARKKETTETTDSVVSQPETTKTTDRASVFVPPTREDVEIYCTSAGIAVDPDEFLNFYASKGWMVGKNMMKDWKAALRTWDRRSKNDPRPSMQGPEPAQADYLDEMKGWI